jgi:hypothetical protein
MVQGEGSVNSSAVGSEALAAVLRQRSNSLPVPTGAPKSRNDIPVFDQETILHACLDLTETEREYMTLDVSGHYSRPDLFRFSVAEERRE